MHSYSSCALHFSLITSIYLPMKFCVQSCSSFWVMALTKLSQTEDGRTDFWEHNKTTSHEVVKSWHTKTRGPWWPWIAHLNTTKLFVFFLHWLIGHDNIRVVLYYRRSGDREIGLYLQSLVFSQFFLNFDIVTYFLNPHDPLLNLAQILKRQTFWPSLKKLLPYL